MCCVCVAISLPPSLSLKERLLGHWHRRRELIWWVNVPRGMYLTLLSLGHPLGINGSENNAEMTLLGEQVNN